MLLLEELKLDLENYIPKIKELYDTLELDKAKKLLPRERLYPVTMSVAKALALHV